MSSLISLVQTYACRFRFGEPTHLILSWLFNVLWHGGVLRADLEKGGEGEDMRVSIPGRSECVATVKGPDATCPLMGGDDDKAEQIIPPTRTLYIYENMCIFKLWCTLNKRITLVNVNTSGLDTEDFYKNHHASLQSRRYFQPSHTSTSRLHKNSTVLILLFLFRSPNHRNNHLQN